MPNFEYIRAENGEVIQVNSAELRTEDGQAWLAEQLDQRRQQIVAAVNQTITPSENGETDL